MNELGLFEPLEVLWDLTKTKWVKSEIPEIKYPENKTYTQLFDDCLMDFEKYVQ